MTAVSKQTPPIPGKRVVAVLGATGFQGTAVVTQLRAAGWCVRGIARRSNPACDETVRLDAATATVADLAAALEGAQAALNLVGIKVGDDERFEAVHVTFVRRLLQAMDSRGIDRLIHVGAVVTDPRPHRYHRTKLEAEAVVEAWAGRWTNLRPSIVWGRGDDFVRKLGGMVRASRVIPVPLGRAPIRPVWVGDVASAIRSALDGRGVRERADLVGPVEAPLSHWLHVVAEARALPVTAVPVPKWLFQSSAAVLEKMSRQDPLVTLGQGHLLSGGFSSSENGLGKFGITPRPLDAEAAREVLREGDKPLPVRLRWKRPKA